MKIGEVVDLPSGFLKKPLRYVEIMGVVDKLGVGQGFLCEFDNVDELRSCQVNLLSSFRKGRMRGRFGTKKYPGQNHLWIFRLPDEEQGK